MSTTDSNRILVKLVFLLKRHLDDWVQEQLVCPTHLEFNKSHLQSLMSIGSEGISNNGLAEKLNITKQGTSKIIKDMEAINLVRSEKSPADARAVMLYLTEDGVKLYQHFLAQIDLLEQRYKKLVGAKNYETAIDVLIKIMDYHQKQVPSN